MLSASVPPIDSLELEPIERVDKDTEGGIVIPLDSAIETIDDDDGAKLEVDEIDVVGVVTTELVVDNIVVVVMGVIVGDGVTAGVLVVVVVVEDGIVVVVGVVVMVVVVVDVDVVVVVVVGDIVVVVVVDIAVV